MSAILSADMDCVALDLPGFGAHRDDPRVSVAQMLDWLADEVRARDPAVWMVVGHSMGGKLATLLTARAEAGAAGLSALAGTVLVAGSPPVPEPMDEARRDRMIGWFADGQPSRAEAEDFVDANTSRRLPDPWRDRAVSDVLRTGRHAWLAWLERGSREDWSDRVGTLNTPALIVAGADDGDLGEVNQRALNAPLYRRHDVAVVPHAAHLIPLEQPERLAALIAAHWVRVAPRALPADFARALASDRASDRTRAALLARVDAPADGEPGLLSPEQLQVLGAVAARVLPGCEAGLARHVDRALAAGEGDGWRFADLPPDADAWPLALDALARADFATMRSGDQDALLARLADGEGPAGALSPAQMKLWFEDARAELVRHWLSQPRAQARVGYSGGLTGDAAHFRGYARTAADSPEPWEPRA